MSAYKLVVILRGLSFGMTLPIWVAYLSQKGMSLIEIGILGTLFESFKFAFEIPLGYFSDLLGEKKALLLSSLFLASTWLFFVLSGSVYSLAVVVLLWSLGEALFSGTYESWLSNIFDKEQFQSKYGSSVQLYTVSNVLGALLVPLIQMQSEAYPYFIAALLFLFEFFVYLKTKFKIHKIDERISGMNQLTLRKIFSQKLFSAVVIRILIIAFITDLAYDGIDRFWQPLLLNLKFSDIYFGPIYAFAGILSVLILQAVKKMSKLNSLRALLIIEIIGVALIFLLTQKAELTFFVYVSFLLTVSSVRGVFFKSLLNFELPNGPKATLFSILSGVGAAGEIIAGVLIGWIGSKYGLSKAFLSVGIIMLPILLIYIFELMRAKREV